MVRWVRRRQGAVERELNLPWCPTGTAGNHPISRAGAGPAQGLPVSLTRTSRGWSVLSPAGTEDAADLIEGLSLADLVAEELGALTEPDRTARRSARGPSGALAPPRAVDIHGELGIARVAGAWPV